jgi:hypothetical protein
LYNIPKRQQQQARFDRLLCKSVSEIKPPHRIEAILQSFLPPDRKMKRFLYRRAGRQQMVFLPFCFPERLRMGHILVGFF